MASWTLSWKTRISSQDGLGLVEVAGALKSTRGMVSVVGSVIPKNTSGPRPRAVVPHGTAGAGSRPAQCRADGGLRAVGPVRASAVHE